MRVNRYATLSVLLLSVAATAAIQAEELQIKPGEQIVAIGDSITRAGGYLRVMDAVFAKQYADMKLPPIINVGVSGHKAENLIARFDRDVIQKKPAVLTLNIGINDVWHRLRAPHDENVLKAYKENVAKMVDTAQAAGIRVVLCTPTIIQENLEAEGNKRLALYSQAMKQIAAEKKCLLADLHALFLEAVAGKPADAKGNVFTSDGVHMSPAGDMLMATGILKALGVPQEKIDAAK